MWSRLVSCVSSSLLQGPAFNQLRHTKHRISGESAVRGKASVIRYVPRSAAIDREQGAVVRELNRLRKGRRYRPYNDRIVHEDCTDAIAARRAKWETWEKEAEEG